MSSATAANANAVPSMTNADGSMNWGAILAGLASGYNSVSGQTGSQQTAAAAAADPFASQRGQYQQQLLGIMNGTTDIFNDPAFKQMQQSALEGVNRNDSALGMSNSGNRAIDLNNSGMKFAESYEQQTIQNLLTASGANTGSPGAAGQILSNAPNATNAGTAAGLSALTSLLQSSGLPAATIAAITKAIGGGGPGGGVPSGDMGIDAGGGDQGLGGSLVDTNAIPDGVSSGDANIINDVFGGGNPTDLSQFGSLFGG